MIDLNLSPHIVVNAWLREQRKRKQAYRDWFDMVYERDWKLGPVKGVGLQRLASDYQEQLAAAHAFGIKQQGEAARLLLKSDKGFQLRAHTLWPLNVGQDVNTPEAYTEDAISLVRVGAEFAPKKVAAHEAPLNFYVTRHALERLIERQALPGDLHTELAMLVPKLANDAAALLFFGIVNANEDEADWARTAYIPCRGGIVVLTNRLVAAPRYAEDIGWRVNFNKNNYSQGYLKKDLLVADHKQERSPDLLMISIWFVTTFFASNQLSPKQTRYYEEARVFIDNLPAAAAKRAFEVQFDPDYIYRPSRSVPGEDMIDLDTAHSLREQASNNLFKQHPRHPISFLVDPNISTKKLRSFFPNSVQSSLR